MACIYFEWARWGLSSFQVRGCCFVLQRDLGHCFCNIIKSGCGGWCCFCGVDGKSSGSIWRGHDRERMGLERARG